MAQIMGTHLATLVGLVLCCGSGLCRAKEYVVHNRPAGLRLGQVLGGLEFGALEQEMEEWTAASQRLIDEAIAARESLPVDQILPIYNAAVEATPGAFQPYMARGSFLASIDDVRVAEVDFIHGLELVPAHVGPRLLPHAALDLGQAMYRIRDLENAHTAIDMVLNSPHADEQLILNAWYTKGQILTEDAWEVKGSWENVPFGDAIEEAYRTALASPVLTSNPKLAPDIHCNLGMYLGKRHRYSEALDHLNTAVQLDSLHTRAWSELCNLRDWTEGNGAGEACGQDGVAAGVWRRPQQRPAQYNFDVENEVAWPDLDAWPRHQAALDELEEHWELVRDEALALLDVEGANGLRYGTMEGLAEPDETYRGRWHARVIDCETNKRWRQKNQRGRQRSGKLGSQGDTPETCRALDAMLETMGGGTDLYTAQFLRLEPGGYIRPHAGEGNFRWVAHLGLVVRDEVGITVGDEYRMWKEGKVLVFDDSFVHHVRHNGSSDRIVLALQLPNPNSDIAKTRLDEDNLLSSTVSGDAEAMESEDTRDEGKHAELKLNWAKNHDARQGKSNKGQKKNKKRKNKGKNKKNNAGKKSKKKGGAKKKTMGRHGEL